MVSDSTSAGRIGPALFTIYCLFYGGFILLAAFKGALLRDVTLGGINLAVIYGFGLIIGAFVLALLYAVLCRNPTAAPAEAKP